MTSSDPEHDSATRIVEHLIEETDESLLTQRIDEPVDRAAACFNPPADEPYTQEGFHATITAFVRCVYEHAQLFGCKLTESQAHDEAVSLLTQAYRGAFFDGFEGAVSDGAYCSGSGMHLVIEQLAVIIKGRLRHTYKRWVFLRHLDPADWQTRQAVAAILLEQCRPYAPAELLTVCSPGLIPDKVLVELVEICAQLPRPEKSHNPRH